MVTSTFIALVATVTGSTFSGCPSYHECAAPRRVRPELPWLPAGSRRRRVRLAREAGKHVRVLLLLPVLSVVALMLLVAPAFRQRENRGPGRGQVHSRRRGRQVFAEKHTTSRGGLSGVNPLAEGPGGGRGRDACPTSHTGKTCQKTGKLGHDSCTTRKVQNHSQGCNSHES